MNTNAIPVVFPFRGLRLRAVVDFAELATMRHRKRPTATRCVVQSDDPPSVTWTDWTDADAFQDILDDDADGIEATDRAIELADAILRRRLADAGLAG